ncbi:MAG: hypothetical protein M5U26_19770 [Planctomycetota bacterium]|nr:hypothetical protein [Planctomycetota bacterium]
MIIILAGGQIDLGMLDGLVALYDAAKTESERERAFEDIYALAGERLRAMVWRAAGGASLDGTDVDTLAREALGRALRESGVARLHRVQGDWQALLGALLGGRNEAGRRLWGLLTPALQERMRQSQRYLKATDANVLLKELNALLTRHDLPVHLGLGPARTGAMPDIAYANAGMLVEAFPGAQIKVLRPPRNILGYLSKIVLPEMRKQIREMAGRRPLNAQDAAIMSALRPALKQYEEMKGTGTLPPELAGLPFAAAVNALYRADLDRRYGPARAWWEQMVRKIRPDNPFVVKDVISWRSAKALFEQAGVPADQWREPGSPYYIPKGAMKPYGIQTVERVLGLPSMRSLQGPGAGGEQRPLPRAPEAAPGWAGELALSHGGGADLYRQVVEQLFARPGYEAEHAVGLMLARSPNPTPADVEQYLGTIDAETAEVIREIGWASVAREVDRRVLEVVSDPARRGELARQTGQAPRALTAAVGAVRRALMARRICAIIKRAA